MTIPRGKLLIIGGSEHKGDDSEKKEINPDFIPQEILKRLLSEMNSDKKNIATITTASENYQEEIGRDYKKAFEAIGCQAVSPLEIRDRKDAYKESNIKKIKKAGAVMFCGGNQLRLSTILGGTDVMDIIREKYEKEKFIIAGTSAGAMVMSPSMIVEGKSETALYKGELKITTGFGFLDGVIIDTHFLKRGRFGRLSQAVAINPEQLGIGVEEDTAVLVTEGKDMEVIGSGNVIIIDGQKIVNSNLAFVDNGIPISIEGLYVHILSKGDRFSLKELKVKPGY
jgi:cyanophycinase